MELLDVVQIKDAYTSDELKVEMKKLNDELKALGEPEIERNKTVYPRLVKAAYADCVSKARLALLDLDEDWIEKKKDEILEQNDIRRKGKEQKYKKKSGMNSKMISFA